MPPTTADRPIVYKVILCVPRFFRRLEKCRWSANLELICRVCRSRSRTSSCFSQNPRFSSARRPLYRSWRDAPTLGRDHSVRVLAWPYLRQADPRCTTPRLTSSGIPPAGYVDWLLYHRASSGSEPALSQSHGTAPDIDPVLRFAYGIPCGRYAQRIGIVSRHVPARTSSAAHPDVGHWFEAASSLRQ